MPEPPQNPSTFELAGGSIVGTDHRAVPKNNQDAWQIQWGRDITEVVAVVCDGCGSGVHSEVGAQLGARLLCTSILQEITAHGDRFYWERVERDVLSAIHTLAIQMGGNYRRVIEEYFLFSVVGVVLTGRNAHFFALGDGLMIVNGAVNAAGWHMGLGPWPDNAPPYLAYQLLGGRGFDFMPHEMHLAGRTVPTADVDTFLIGCDGAGDPGLLQVCERGATYPGMSREIGPISQFWTDDAIFRNPDALRRRLKMIARDWPIRDPQHGLLADDTTIIVGRRGREA